MSTQFVPFSPFTMFQPNGPLGFWPNNFAANAGDLPNVLWVSSLQTPLLNSFSPVLPPLVTNIFGGGPQPLGSGFRPAPLGANPNSGVATGGNIGIPGSGQLPQFGGQTPGGANGIGSITGPTGVGNVGSTTGGSLGFGAVGGQGDSGNFGFLQSIGAGQSSNSLGSLGNLGGLGSIGSIMA